MKYFSILLLLILSIAFCEGKLQRGDLIFVMEEKTSDFSNAITDATTRHDSINIVHIGIIDRSDSGDLFVIEASPQEGVRRISLEEFLKGVPMLEGMPGVLVKRPLIEISIDAAIERALSHLGEPYDWYYLPDNGKMYCSELVSDSYLKDNGNMVFEREPMRFRRDDGSMPQFWIDLFNKLGTTVPEGVGGTNPNSLFRSPYLITIDFNKEYYGK